MAARSASSSAVSIDREKMNIVIVGHVDHGKSTIIGRLLADTHSLPDGKLEKVKAECERNSKPFEYAFLIDSLEDEQAQGITIDVARVFFKTEKRNYIIIDAPGHIEFLKNMITGAARAEAALLVIDAHEGIRENSRRHGYMLSMLGISQVTVLVNKMDLAGYDEKIFKNVVKEYTAFLDNLGLKAVSFLPISGREGDNMVSPSPKMKWHKGPTVLEQLDQFRKEKENASLPLRMPVQDVYKFTKFGDARRLIAGTIDTGIVKAGDEVCFYPSGKKSVVKDIEVFHPRNGEAPKELGPGSAASLTLEEQIYVKRGELMVHTSQERPAVATRLQASVFWLGKKPLVTGKEYILKTGTARVAMKLEAIDRVIDASDLNQQKKDQVDRHDVADCTLVLSKPVAFDTAEKNAVTSRFVIVDEYEITGGGIIRQVLPDASAGLREAVLMRNLHWERSLIPMEERGNRYGQKPVLVLITGELDAGRKEMAKKLEKVLFEKGRFAYFLGLSSVLHGLDSDLDVKSNHREEHIRRLAEVANLMLDSGLILVATAPLLGRDDISVFHTAIPSEQVVTIWVGTGEMQPDFNPDLASESAGETSSEVERILELLHNRDFLFRIF